MNLRTRAAAVLSVLALASGLGVATSVPASAITTRTDISYEGNSNGNNLESCDAVGDTVFFGNGCYNFWDYQLEGSAGGDGKYYYVHPNGHDNLCMTASTTSFGVIKIETCVAASQQYWWNPHNSAGYYHLFNAYWGAFLTDQLGGGNANLTFSCYYGNNGCTFIQL